MEAKVLSQHEETQDNASFQKSVQNLENQTGPNHEVCFCVKVLPLSL